MLKETNRFKRNLLSGRAQSRLFYKTKFYLKLKYFVALVFEIKNNDVFNEK